MSFFVAEDVTEAMGRSTYFQAGFLAFLASGGLGVPSYEEKTRTIAKLWEKISLSLLENQKSAILSSSYSSLY